MKFKSFILLLFLNIFFSNFALAARTPAVFMKMGKVPIKFKQSNLTVQSSNSGSSFEMEFLNETKKKGLTRKLDTLKFEFQDTDLRLGKYRLVGKGNYQEAKGDVLVQVGTVRLKNRKTGYSFHTDSDTSLTGNLNILAIDAENQTIEAEFQLEADLVAQKLKKGKLKERRREMTVHKGKIKTNLEGVGRHVFLEGPRFFTENGSGFALGSKISSAEAASVSSAAKAHYELDGFTYYTDNVTAYNDSKSGQLTIVDIKIVGENEDGSSYDSLVRFGFRNKYLEQGQKFIFSNVNALNGSYFSRIAYVAPAVIQTYTDEANGIEEISRISVDKIPYDISGEMTVLEYNAETGEMKLGFDFKANVYFSHRTTDGLLKGPFVRPIELKNGYVEAIID